VIGSVNIAQLAGHVRGLTKERHAAAVTAVRLVVKEHGRPIMSETIKATVPSPFDRGDYDRSWKAISIPNGVRFASSSAYASTIDDGRRPGTMPNVQAIVGWVHRHGLATRAISARESSYRRRFLKTATALGSYARRMAQAGLKERAVRQVEQEERSIAFAVAMAIKKRGTPAKHVFARAKVRLIVLCTDAARFAISGAKESVA
jgi:hypothetical protein